MSPRIATTTAVSRVELEDFVRPRHRAVLLTARREITAVDDQHAHDTPEEQRPLEAAALTVGDA